LGEFIEAFVHPRIAVSNVCARLLDFPAAMALANAWPKGD